jgi:hypothetical protein
VTRSFPPPTRRTPYVETFDDGSGGWFTWKPAPEMPSPSDESSIPPEIRDGVLVTRSPWWVDSNHAPPGAGYLHLLAYLLTNGAHIPPKGWPNRFVEGGYSRDLRDAVLNVRLRGEVTLRGAELVLLAQATLPKTTANLVLTGQPIPIEPAWADRTITLSPDPDQWTCLGARHDLGAYYGCAEPEDVLRDVNVDLILVLFPLQIVPTEPVADIHLGRPHRRVTQEALRSGTRPRDPGYDVDWAFLPDGWVEIDTVRIDYPVEQA